MNNSAPESVSENLINFVSACLVAGVINNEELNLWAEKILIENSLNEIPNYIFDLINFDEAAFKIYKKIEFVPVSKDLPEGSLELSGLAALRTRLSPDTDVDIPKALNALQKRPEIIEKFKQAFPFINFPEGVPKL